MVVGEDANGLLRKQELIHIAILFAVAAGIGVYLIATTVLIAKDGVMYIQYAKEFAVEPLITIQDRFAQPGYAFLVCVTNKLIGLLYSESSLESWVISAQSVSLLCKIIATVVLYFVGTLLVGPRISFWAVLILTILPLPAQYGSDALTDWPHIMFLSIGFLLLLLGARLSNWWLFGCAGIIAGLGYLIREECCQLVIYGVGWLFFNLIRPQIKMNRAKAAAALILLLAGFAVISLPYMEFMGYILPEHRIGPLPLFADAAESNIDTINVSGAYFSRFVPAKIAGGLWKLSSNVCETLMYYFVPALLIGIYYHFRKQAKGGREFFITAFILFNVVLLLWLYCNYTFSRRHSLPLVVFTIFYIPLGLQVLADWLRSRFSKERLETSQNPQLWFFVLLSIGAAICLPKLLRPIRVKKQGYRTAASWLKENTAHEDLIGVPDGRIGFYAERRGVPFVGDKIPEGAKYVVRQFRNQDEMLSYEKTTKVRLSLLSNWQDENTIMAIYGVLY